MLSFRGDTASPSYGDVEVHGLSVPTMAWFREAGLDATSWPRIFAVRAGDSTGLPMLGTYSIGGDTLRFRPRFAPVAGVRYFAQFDPSGFPMHVRGDTSKARVITATWQPARVNRPATTTVQAIYPSANDLPMNLLRMYVHFSAPMSTGKAFDYIKLFKDRDSLVHEPFFTAGGVVELWDPDKTRLTILFDPGRIKRDLRPNEELGLPLRTGQRYRLVIDSSWPDARGRPLVHSHVKLFRVGPQDRSLIRTEAWIVRAPIAGTRDSLRIQFPEPLDHALLQRLLTVRDSSGRALDGTVVVGPGETRWAFTPAQPWGPVAHFLVVDTELEDLAGNSLKKLFDVAPGDSTGVEAPAVRLRFTPR